MNETIDSIAAKYLDGKASEQESIKLMDELEKSSQLRMQLNIMAAGLRLFKDNR